MEEDGLFRGTDISLRTRISLVSPIGGVLALISIILPWWEMGSNLAHVSISLLGVSQSAPVSVGNVTVSLEGPLAGVVRNALLLVVAGGVLGFVGTLFKWASAFGAVLVFIGAGYFVVGLYQAIAPLELYGSISFFGLSVSWGLSWGLYLAVVAFFVLLGSAGGD